MKTAGAYLVATCTVLLLSQAVNAQRGGGPGGGPPGGKGNKAGGPRGPVGNGLTQGARQNNTGANNQIAQGVGGQNGRNANMPSIAELSQRLITNFDTDGTGELNQVELQNALMAIRDMMMQRMQGNQNQIGQNQTGQGSFANQGNAFGGGRSNRQAGQAQGNRPPRPGGGSGGGGGRRGR